MSPEFLVAAQGSGNAKVLQILWISGMGKTGAAQKCCEYHTCVSPDPANYLASLLDAVKTQGRTSKLN